MGASLGVLYNRNTLEVPYIFQSQPTLQGAKVLLDLETEGWDVNGQFGFVWEPVKTLKMGASYTTETRFRTQGRAHSDAGVQLRNIGLVDARTKAAWDAEVTNVFPQKLSAGLTWQATRSLLLAVQFDWLGWASAYEALEVRLSNGTNDDLNALVRSDKLHDDVPLEWDDQFIVRVGLEYAVSERWSIRAGYAHGNNPIPAATLTPLTDAITEHTVSAGFGYRRAPFSVDVAWQWSLPHEETTGRSKLLSGEYNNSQVEVSLQRLVLTGSWTF